MPRVLLVGGPCDGQRKNISADAFALGETTCKGETYVYDGVTRPPSQLPHFTFRKGAPPPGGTGGGTPATYAPVFYRSWADLEEAVNRRLPTALHRITVSQVRVLQTLAH